MLARVVRFEGGDKEAIERNVAEIRSQSESGPPEGVPSNGFLLLSDSDGGKVMFVALFDSEDDYRQGDETLNSMSPPSDGDMGQRVSVDKYEVAVDVRL